MINILSEWVKNISLSLIIVSILEMILPNNKTKKYVKMIMGLYILFCIISPFIENKIEIDLSNLDTYLEDIEEVSSEKIEVDQTSMEMRLDEIYKQQLQKDIKIKIEENGYEVESCNVKAHISETDGGIEKIVLKIKNKTKQDISNEKEKETFEDKIVTEIQKIQKVDIKIFEKDNKSKDYKESNDDEDNKDNITDTDIKIIKNLLIQEYGVDEKCLKIN